MTYSQVCNTLDRQVHSQHRYREKDITIQYTTHIVHTIYIQLILYRLTAA